MGTITWNNSTEEAINEDRGGAGTGVGHAKNTYTAYNEARYANHLGTRAGRGRISSESGTSGNWTEVNHAYYPVWRSHDVGGSHISLN